MENNHDTHSQIMFLLGEIRGDIKGVHQRLDALNGKTAKNSSRIDDLEIKEATRAGKAVGMGLVGGSVISVIAWVVNKFT